MTSHAPNTKHESKKYVCDICAKEGNEVTFNAPTALGMHKRTKHGILGTSQASIQYRAAKAKQAKATISPELVAKRAKQNEYAANRRAKLIAAKAEYHSTKGAKHELVAISKGAYSNGEAIALITVGRIQAFCETEAKKHGISEESFTRRCAELLFASQVR